MKTHFAIRKPRPALCSLVLGLILNASAQELYTHDPAGNLIAAASGTGGPPSIIVGPQSRVVQSNSFVTLSVVATGAGVAYQWLSNGVPIAGATGDSLVLPNLA